MKLAGLLASACLAVAGLAATPAAAATLLFDFTQDGTGGGLAGVTGPYGQVTATDHTGGVDFTVTLAPDFQFRSSRIDGHRALEFLIPKADAGDAITGLASPFKRVAGTSFVNPPFVTIGSKPKFDVAIECVPGKQGKIKTACQPGYSSLNPTSMSFHMVGITTANLESILYNGRDIFFSSDIAYRSPTTGAVVTGNIGAVAAAPEPAAWTLLILGVGMIGGAIRRRSGGPGLAPSLLAQ